MEELSDSITIVPILRSGLVMSDALQFVFENCTVVHLGIYRDEKLSAIKYYEKFPSDISSSKVILCDPLIATGSTVLKAMKILEKYNCQDIILLGIIISQQAVELLSEKYPKLNIYVGAIDSAINDQGYLVPGVGDAGNRLFGTK